MIPRKYANGQYPASELVEVDRIGTRLNRDAAAVFLRIVADAARVGVTVRPTPPSAGQPKGLAGYRDLKTQQWLRDHPLGPVKIAPPGSSTHGWGDVVDVGDVGGQKFMVANAVKYGLSRPLLAQGEPWHFQLNKTLSQLGLAQVKPTGSITVEADMPKVIRRTGNYKEWSLVWPPLIGEDMTKELGYITTTDPKRAGEWERAYANGYGSADMLGAKSESDDNRDAYMRQQAEARMVHMAWRRGQAAVHAGGATVGVDYARIAKETADVLAKRLVS